jgi:hypothetical protein
MKKGINANTNLLSRSRGYTSTMRSYLIFIPSTRFPYSLLKLFRNDFSFKDFLFIISLIKIARGIPVRYKAVKTN